MLQEQSPHNHRYYDVPPPENDDRFYEIAQRLAVEAGLREHEATRLVELCQGLTIFSTYPELADESRGLAEDKSRWQQTDLLGYSEDNPEGSDNPRPIYGTRIGDADGHIAFVEGAQHGNEEIGSATANTLKKLALIFPFFRRMGYGGMVVSDHADPDAMILQVHGKGPLTLPCTPLLYRGSSSDQHSWGFPTSASAYVNNDVAITLEQIQRYDVAFFAALHGSVSSSEINTDRVAVDEVDFYPRMLRALGFPISPIPEQPLSQTFGPGINISMTRQTSEDNRVINTSPQAKRHKQVGTTVCDHLVAGTKYFNPDIGCYYPNPDPGDPLTGQTFYDIARERTTKTLQAIEGIQKHTSDPSFSAWIEEHRDAPGHPEINRLIRAVEWWRDDVADIFEGDLLSLQRTPIAHDPRILRQSETPSICMFKPYNTAIYLGNIARLASEANLPGLHEQVHGEALAMTELLPWIRPIPIGWQVAAQSIATIAAMNYARQP